LPIGAWFLIALVALTHRKFECPINFSQALSFVRLDRKIVTWKSGSSWSLMLETSFASFEWLSHICSACWNPITIHIGRSVWDYTFLFVYQQPNNKSI